MSFASAQRHACNRTYVSRAPRSSSIFNLESGAPLGYVLREDVEAGGLMSYGAKASEPDRHGTYVGHILKVEKPTDLPMVQPTKFDLAIKPANGQDAARQRGAANAARLPNCQGLRPRELHVRPAATRNRWRVRVNRGHSLIRKGSDGGRYIEHRLLVVSDEATAWSVQIQDQKYNRAYDKPHDVNW
jgi:hypothetical protein